MWTLSTMASAMALGMVVLRRATQAAKFAKSEDPFGCHLVFRQPQPEELGATDVPVVLSISLETQIF